MSQPRRGYWAEVWRQFRRVRLNQLSLLAIVVVAVLAVFADFIASDKPLYLRMDGQSHVLPNLFRPAALRMYTNQSLLEELGPEDVMVLPLIPFSYNTHDKGQELVAPNAAHPLGTDLSGRDVAARMVHGARVSLAVGILAVCVLVVIGVVLGSLAGYFGGMVDGAVNRVVEIVLSVPSLLLLATMIGVINPQGWAAVITMMVAIGLINWTGVARLIRAEILRIKALPYVEAARALGAGHARLIIVHVLPNAISPVLVAATFAMASAILTEGALSFLGFGIPNDMASWGGLLNGVRGHMEAWWLAVFPGLAIFVTVTAYNLAGEGLRDAIDPRLNL